MKKWFVLALIACVAVAVQAGEDKKKDEGKDKKQSSAVSKEQFVAQQKKMAEKKGKEFDQAKVEARFDKLDKNKDGKLTDEEKPQGKKQSSAVSKEKYVAQQKQMAEKKSKEFDQAKAEAKFDKMDKSKDGKLTGDEIPPAKGKGKSTSDEKKATE